MYIIHFASLIPTSVGDFLILLLKESGESWTIPTPIRFGSYRDLIIVWFVSWEFLEPYLCKMPKRPGRICSTVCSGVDLLTRECADIECFILRWNTIGEVFRANCSFNEIRSDISEYIIRESNLNLNVC